MPRRQCLPSPRPPAAPSPTEPSPLHTHTPLPHNHPNLRPARVAPLSFRNHPPPHTHANTPGKTFTMIGTRENRGVNHRALMSLFADTAARGEAFEFGFKASMLEIYNENVVDLLGPSGAARASLEIRQVRRCGRTGVWGTGGNGCGFDHGMGMGKPALNGRGCGRRRGCSRVRARARLMSASLCAQGTRGKRRGGLARDPPPVPPPLSPPPPPPDAGTLWGARSRRGGSRRAVHGRR
jgi:hypothetical protein